MTKQLKVGDFIFVVHPDEEEWHERLLTAHVKGTIWVALTPDEDHYDIELALELDQWVVVGPRGGLPPKLRSTSWMVYRFRDVYSKKQLAAVFDEGATISAAVMIERGLVAKSRRPGLNLPLGNVAGASAGIVVPQDGAAIAADELDTSHVWLLLEATPGHKIGEDVSLSYVASSIVGESALCHLGGDLVLRCVRVPLEDVGDWVTKNVVDPSTPRGAEAATASVVEDARILPVQRDSTGRRYRAFVDSARLFSEEMIDDWDIQGPRTVKWCMKKIAEDGSGAKFHFAQWKNANKLDDVDHGVEVCEMIAEVVETAVTRDHLDISNLLCFETLERKRQWIEESYRQKLEERRIQKFGGGRDPGAITAEAFAGRPRMLGHSIVNPELIAYVARKAAEDSEILKQQRKALEARGLSLPGAKKGAK